MKNGSCTLRVILKRLRRKRILVKNCRAICLCLFFTPQALINPSEGRSFHFDFLIFRF